MADYTAPMALIGTAALDILHFWDDSHTAQTGVRVEIGGVCKHVGCVMGNLGVTPQFLSTQYHGELGGCLSDLLIANHVDWLPLTDRKPFSLFEGHIDPQDHVFAETFVEGEAITALTPEILRQQKILASAKIIVTCTNLTVPAMNELAAIAAENGARFCLLTSSLLESPRIAQITYPIDLISLNVSELQNLTGHSMESLEQIAITARGITWSGGKCLVTLGSQGALLCQEGIDYALYQPVEPIRGRSPVGGGDVLFASLLVGKIRGQSWEDAFAFSAACTRHYLMRDPEAHNPYSALTMIDPQPTMPPIERIPLPDVR
jgi:sugar/nucleoside kinase (ribokinase family)